jgi:hypothetical protein
MLCLVGSKLLITSKSLHGAKVVGWRDERRDVVDQVAGERWSTSGHASCATADRAPAPATSRPAAAHGPVSHAWILNLRRLAGNLERVRIDRQLDEALATGGDPLHLAAVFGISEGAAIRYAVNARKLLQETHATRPPDSSRTEGST